MSVSEIRRLFPVIVVLVCWTFTAGCSSLTGVSSESADNQPVETPEAEKPTPAEEVQSLHAEARKAYQNRGETGEVERAIELWNEAVEHRGFAELSDDQRAQLFIDLSRAHYFVARYLRADGPVIDTDTELGDALRKGGDAAERAVEILAPDFYRAVDAGAPFEARLPEAPPEATEALLWQAKHLDMEAKTGDESTSVSLRPVVDAIMEHVDAHRPELYHGAAQRYFGVRWVDRLFHRDMEASRQAFETSLELAPDFLMNRLLKALHLAAATEDRELFERQLEAILETTRDSGAELEPENEIVRRWATELMENADDFFGEATDDAESDPSS